jgi:hypothetical protein
MDIHQIATITLIVILTLFSGFFDAQGFIHASHLWKGGKLVPLEAFKSALGFGLGIGLYWLCIRFLKDVKIISPEIQTLGWFSMTILGVAILNGSFFQWQRIDQIVGIFVFVGIIWLLVRTSM